LKTIVINERENERVPFLRGILTRSLLDAGLAFEDAFELATRVRDQLADIPEIASEELRQRVSRILQDEGDEEALEQYCLPAVAPSRILVICLSGTVSAFSRGRHVRYLQSSGMRPEKAEQTTALIYDQLIATGISSITTSELGYLTYLCLQQEVGKKAAKRYLVWSEFQRSGRPLALLICGTVGTGKSTIATEIAHMFEITRIQSTDMLREVMRMMIPKRLLPVLHTSSFSAWKSLPVEGENDRDHDQMIAAGYRSQVELLAVPCEAVLQRAVEECVPIILEGVHVHPDLLARTPKDSDVITVHITLAVLKSKELKSRLRGRGAEVPHRRAKRYLNNFDSIWRLQSFLLSEADRCDVPIIPNEDKEKSILQITQQVNVELARHFTGTTEQIFGAIAGQVKEQAETSSWREIVPLLRDLSRSRDN
jgi:2-phosphoglycerate kinase